MKDEGTWKWISRFDPIDARTLSGDPAVDVQRFRDAAQARRDLRAWRRQERRRRERVSAAREEPSR